jgi:glutamate--cysteine ligase
MIQDSENLIEKLLNSISKETILAGRCGIEKETLRVNKNGISILMHPEALGSSLCNSYITTDFSESLLEFITPPFKNPISTVNFLDAIHHFVYDNLDNELLWPYSMPPLFKDENDIEIANYGSSNLALFKRAYRSGLSHRYGKGMQVIAGIHYNYSLSDDIWSLSDIFGSNSSDNKIKAEFYFRALRNIQRMNWLILYFFGASPIVTRNFIDKDRSFKKSLDAYYLPYATSIRMSDLGYNNAKQSNLKVSANSLQQYILDLKTATSVINKDYESIFGLSDEVNPQINACLLQIEDEYYSVARPKSNYVSNERQISKLYNHGIDYIELRSIDLNPFSRVGVTDSTVKFLEMFILYCTFKDSPLLSSNENEVIRRNDFLVAQEGRRKDLLLNNNGREVSLKDWANKILDDMTPLAEFIGYEAIILKKREQINDSRLTLSGLFLAEFLESKLSFHDFSHRKSEDNKKHYLHKLSSNYDEYKILQDEVLKSIVKQETLERSDDESYQEYVDRFFNAV